MMKIFLAVFFTSVAASTTEELHNAPGRAIFWSPHEGKASRPEYRAQSLVTSALNDIFENTAKGNEIVAIIKSADGRLVLAHNSVKDSIRLSSKSVVMPYIYHTQNVEQQASLLAGAESLQNVKKIDLPSFVQILQDHNLNPAASGPMTNGVLDAYEISLTGHETDHELMSTVSNLASKSSTPQILFVAVEEPMINAVSLSKNGFYSRVLSANSTTNSSGIFYKPEGSEYSIYYANTYLYITPDIFTGLMTGIFVFFVLLTGYSCLGAIQGNSVYPSKMPVLGREA